MLIGNVVAKLNGVEEDVGGGEAHIVMVDQQSANDEKELMVAPTLLGVKD